MTARDKIEIQKVYVRIKDLLRLSDRLGSLEVYELEESLKMLEKIMNGDR